MKREAVRSDGEAVAREALVQSLDSLGVSLERLRAETPKNSANCETLVTLVRLYDAMTKIAVAMAEGQ